MDETFFYVTLLLCGWLGVGSFRFACVGPGRFFIGGGSGFFGVVLAMCFARCHFLFGFFGWSSSGFGSRGRRCSGCRFSSRLCGHAAIGGGCGSVVSLGLGRRSSVGSGRCSGFGGSRLSGSSVGECHESEQCDAENFQAFHFKMFINVKTMLAKGNGTSASGSLHCCRFR